MDVTCFGTAAETITLFVRRQLAVLRLVVALRLVANTMAATA